MQPLIMTTETQAQELSEAITAFALHGTFPDNVSSLPAVSETDVEPAIQTLEQTKTELEAQIHTINQETREEVSSWERNAKSFQQDIIRSKAIANDIVRQSEAPETSGEAIQAAEENAEFLNREVQYSQQLYGALRGIQYVNKLLADVEKACREQRIIDSLRLLEKSWAAIDELGVSKSCRVMRLLDIRSFELKSDVHSVFDQLWKELVQVDIEAGQVLINDNLREGQLSLQDAILGLKAFKEVDERMEQLWHNIDAAIVSPRMNRHASSLPGIRASGHILQLDGTADGSVKSLLLDLGNMCNLIASKLPSDLLHSLCRFMMADIIPKLIKTWLSPAVPTSLCEMAHFDHLIVESKKLCTVLSDCGCISFDELQEWVDDAPKTWLDKCRQKALENIRTSLANGLGKSTQVERVEKHMVSLAEGRELANKGAGATAETKNDWGDDWGDAWGDEEAQLDDNDNDSKVVDGSDAAPVAAAEDDGADAWGWGDEDEPQQQSQSTQEGKAINTDDDDEAADAWGWGEEDTTTNDQEPSSRKEPRKQSVHVPQAATKELVLRETYHISSMPEPVIDLISAIFEDAVVLTRGANEYSHVASTAPGLFNLPTSVLALFRAISPHYYSLDGGGNMFLYNDAMYLAERLSNLSLQLHERSDLGGQARAMLRLEDDVKALQGFANRSYAHEMNLQKTVLRDLIGGSQSLTAKDEWEAAIESGTARIRTMAATWESILARSVWSQAIGSLVDTLATKLITDVLEMSSIGQEDAYSIAKMIATATELDDLFLPSKLAGSAPQGDEVPVTAQYAPGWLRLKYLGEVLQSNLNEVKYLWCESELSLYFSVAEVVDLIEASFENNARTRDAVREIQGNPNPLSG